MNPKISVVIPVYNVEKYLQECIDSLLAQTFQEIEFIFVNDCSPDNCLAILRENERLHPGKIRVIDSPENMCQGGARNLGIRASRGEFIGFVDSDDFVASDMYERLYNKQQECNADAAFICNMLVGSDSKYVDCVGLADKAKNRQWSQELQTMDGRMLVDEDRELLIVSNMGGVWSGLWRKSVIVDNNVWFPEHMKYEDNYWGSLIRCYLQRVGFVNGVGYCYRQNQNSTVHKNNAVYHYDRVKIEEMLIDEAKHRKLFEKYFSAWEFIGIFRYFRNSVDILLIRYDKIDWNTISYVKGYLNKQFPQWKQNKYFLRRYSLKQRILYYLVDFSPKMYYYVIGIYRLIRG